MKQRQKPLKRTELKRSTPLRRTEFKRSGSSLQSGGTNVRGPVKPRRSPGPRSAEKHARGLVAARSGGVCEIQVPGVCLGRASVFSHRKRRSQSNQAEKWCPTNGLAGCGSGVTGCEGYLTEHGSSARARGFGWTVHPSLDPARVPVLRRGQYVWLFPDGSFESLDWLEVAEWIGGAA